MVIAKVKIKPEIQNGDYKIVKQFAWLPKKVDNIIIWLEFYKKVYEFQVKERCIYLTYLNILHKGTWGQWELVAIQRVKL